METLRLWISVLVGICLSGSSLAFSQALFPQHAASFQRAPPPQRPPHSVAQQQQLLEEPQQVNTVTVICHPDSLEVVIAADMFAVGAPVDSQQLHLGVENTDFCRAQPASPEEYRILVGLDGCGTRHWVILFLWLF